jgi:hypothetical protein
MSAPPPEFKHIYVAILRCRTYCDWPSSTRFVSSAYDEPVYLANGRQICLSLHVATYDRRARPETSPARPLTPAEGPILWRGQIGAGFPLGVQIVKAPEDAIEISIDHEPPYEGDIDIQLHNGSEVAVPKDQLTTVASQICTSLWLT